MLNGNIITMNSNSEIQLKLFRKAKIEERVLGRDQYREDLIGAVKFFAGPNSSFITGQTLVVDGGAYFH
jgi:NAD(P)-dependent dehydrogenase (short-subunit alcohol dehydrogenase family)